MKKTNLEITVLAVNQLYQWSKKFIEVETNFYNQFLGVDIFKVDGSIKDKYKNNFAHSFSEKLKDGTNLSSQYFFKKTSTALCIEVQICVNGGKYNQPVAPDTAFCQYQRMTFDLFEVVNNCLVSKNVDRSYLNEVFSENKLLKQANKIKQLAEKYRIEYNKLNYQFKDVLYIERLTRN